ncbi:acyltransferase [Actinomyces sp. MRS3W]|uniref:acyltransferase n=1 Tax=Actinomyces sp. MRS3W TaxID=2800796 RepID=UPI0028FD1D7B|nr:acyltransferase [Actinomyces sp. MRS3W]MDU0347789.1 acyltransferase [Actinomyces sp. MRS3W]
MNPASPARIAPSADVSADATIGEGSSIWHLAQVREHAVLGEGCIVGRGAYIGEGVTLGRHCKVQNYALIYEPARLGDGVFVGPAVTLTNDHFPRAINPDGSLKSASDWEPVGVTIEEGASIGARAVCVAPVTIGAWATVAAGAVVTKDVPAHALVAGVPARRIGWVGRAGQPLTPVDPQPATPEQPRRWRCPATGALYEETVSATSDNNSEHTIREVTH